MTRRWETKWRFPWEITYDSIGYWWDILGRIKDYLMGYSFVDWGISELTNQWNTHERRESVIKWEMSSSDIYNLSVAVMIYDFTYWAYYLIYCSTCIYEYTYIWTYVYIHIYRIILNDSFSNLSSCVDVMIYSSNISMSFFSQEGLVDFRPLQDGRTP